MKKISLIPVALFFSLSLQAMDINDPSDMLYRDIEFWQEQGYYRHIPDLKPYSAQLILSLLNQVIQKGTTRDREIAQYYSSQIDRGFRFDPALELSTRCGREIFGESRITLDLGLKGMLSDTLSLWGDVSGSGVLKREDPDYYMYGDTVPYGQRLLANRKEDAGSVAGVDLMGGTSSMLSYGTADLHGNFGIYRSSFGPFLQDGIVISDEAYQQAHYELTWRKNDFSYTMLMLSLIGSSNTGSDNYSNDASALGDGDLDTTYNKTMVLHSYSWAPFSWLDLGFFESVVYGERFEPVYLLPFSYLFYSQGYAGFADNSLMGLSFRTLLPYKTEVNGILYVDDMNFNEMMKFNFNTKMKMALETGASWSPGQSWLHKISMDYTAVMPYMYTHYDWHSDYEATDFNPDNYSHLGGNLGTTLSPNSDRINLTSNWRLDKTSEVVLFGNWMRHGNASSKLSGAEFSDVETDGSLYDNGINDSGDLFFQKTLPFLTQDVLEKVLQVGLEYTTSLDMPFQDDKRYYGMDISLGYTYERIWNSGRDSSNGNAPEEGNDETNTYFHISFRVFL
jgi:hypothetical protein